MPKASPEDKFFMPKNPNGLNMNSSQCNLGYNMNGIFLNSEGIKLKISLSFVQLLRSLRNRLRFCLPNAHSGLFILNAFSVFKTYG